MEYTNGSELLPSESLEPCYVFDQTSYGASYDDGGNYLWRQEYYHTSYEYNGLTGMTTGNTEYMMTSLNIPILSDPVGYLPSHGSIESNVRLEEVLTEIEDLPNVGMEPLGPGEDTNGYLNFGVLPSGGFDGQTSDVPRVTGDCSSEDVRRPSWLENQYLSLLHACIDDLIRKEYTITHRCNELRGKVLARDSDIAMYKEEIK